MTSTKRSFVAHNIMRMGFSAGVRYDVMEQPWDRCVYELYDLVKFQIMDAMDPVRDEVYHAACEAR